MSDLPSARPTVDPGSQGGRRSRRREAFVWLSVVGLLLLWSTVPIGVAFAGMFDCFGNVEQCRVAGDRQATATVISYAVLCGFTIVTLAAIVVGRRRLPVVLLAMSIAPLFSASSRSPSAEDSRHGCRRVSRSRSPAPSCSPSGPAARSVGTDRGRDDGGRSSRTSVRFVLRLVD